MFSIVITSYNRYPLIMSAINSAIEFTHFLPNSEIIIVDDQSTDGTVGRIIDKYSHYLDSKKIKLIEHKKNLGVTGAKNSGARIATCDWIIFLDSDDELLPNIGFKMMQKVKEVPEFCPVIFFRCANEFGQIIGPKQSVEYWLNLHTFLHQGTPGECLPVVRRAYFSFFNYEEDLRGFEGLTYCKLIANFGPVLVSSVVARIYGTENIDRLSTRTNIRKRGCLIAKGYIRMIWLFYPVLAISGVIKFSIKVLIHLIRCIYSKIITLILLIIYGK
jgi:glycosyltransferase involved in cell wall biosynthesis